MSHAGLTVLAAGKARCNASSELSQECTAGTAWENGKFNTECRLQALFAYLTEEVVTDIVPGHKSIRVINRQRGIRQTLQLSLKSEHEMALQNVRLAI